MADDDLIITARVRIPRTELQYRASRAGGPGGQHVNTSATRVELRWSAVDSPSLGPAARQLVLTRLGHRLDSRGRLRLVSAAQRSQGQNRAEVTARFVRLLAEALVPPKPRKKTKPPRSAAERRLQAKARRSERKRDRRPPQEE